MGTKEITEDTYYTAVKEFHHAYPHDFAYISATYPAYKKALIDAT